MSQQNSPRSAWLLLFFLTLLHILNFVDRQLIANLAKPLIEELHLDLTQVALLYGYGFLVFYTLMGMVMASIADRWHRKRLIAAGLLIWSALTTASGAAMNMFHLAAARAFVGVGEATLTPAALSTLSDAFPPKQRALSSGIYYCGVPLGTGISLIVVGLIAPSYGWRACFYLLGGIGIVLAPFALLLKTPPRGAAEQDSQSETIESTVSTPQSASEIYRSLFAVLRRSPVLLLTIAAAVLLNLFTSSGVLVLTWLTRERGMDYRHTAIINGLIVTVAGLLGTSIGGAVSDWFHRRWAGGRLWFLLFLAIFFLPFMVGFFSLPTNTPYRLFYICWFMTTMGALFWYGPIFATVQDLAPLRIRATAVAFLMLAINIIGTGLGPLIAAIIGDKRGLGVGLPVCAAISYAALIPLFLAAKKYKTIGNELVIGAA